MFKIDQFFLYTHATAKIKVDSDNGNISAVLYGFRDRRFLHLFIINHVPSVCRNETIEKFRFYLLKNKFQNELYVYLVGTFPILPVKSLGFFTVHLRELICQKYFFAVLHC